MPVRLTEIIIYPVKSMRGISLTSSYAGMKGLQYDRRWMLVDRSGHFLTQRIMPTMAIFDVGMNENGFTIGMRNDQLQIPFEIRPEEKIRIDIWESELLVSLAPKHYSEWFSDHLNVDCSLVFMNPAVNRTIPEKYQINKESVSFADAFPYLLTGESSLIDLNGRLLQKLSMDRFRPNLVISGAPAYFEDSLNMFYMGSARFKAVKPCARCMIINTDQITGDRGKEPLRTLAEYRGEGNNVFFGQNLICIKEGLVNVGDALTDSAQLS